MKLVALILMEYILRIFISVILKGLLNLSTISSATENKFIRNLICHGSTGKLIRLNLNEP
jgi:hypothetical protein